MMDDTPQGEPETVVELPSGESILGLYVRGLLCHLMLGIRLDDLGQPSRCAIVTQIAIDTSTRERRVDDHA
jgi:hypothetical protein